jgi:hypothetical protein
MSTRTGVSLFAILLIAVPAVSQEPTAPTAEQLVKYLNDNAARIQSLECPNVQIDAKQGIQGVGFDGQMAFRGPRDLRLRARFLGQPGMDLGSNEQEMWFWLAKSDLPGPIHVKRAELPCTKTGWPCPVALDWLGTVAGAVPHDPLAAEKVVVKADTLELVELVRSPTGETQRKVTVFRRKVGSPQVIAHRVEDTKGQVLMAAHIYELQTDPVSGAVFPVRFRIDWPAEKMEIRVRLPEVHLNREITADRAQKLFTVSEDLKKQGRP